MDKPMTYKGYAAKIEYSDKDECLIGSIANIRHSIRFRGDSVKEIRQAFEDAVDAYLEGCAQRNEAPEKPSESRAVVRISPALNRVLTLVASHEKKSVNTWLAEVVNKKSDKKETILYEVHGNLYINLTNQCTASCVFCIRNTSDGVYGYNLRLSREPSEEEIIQELERLDLRQFKEAVFTGFGEPTCRLDTVLGITQWLSGRGVPVRLDTNGHAALLYPGRNVVAELKAAGLTAVSVSLNAESEDAYNRLCNPRLKGAYRALIDFTKEALRAGLQTRMTVVDHPGMDIDACEKMATGLGASFKVR